MGQYLPVVALIVLAVIFGVLSLLVSNLLSPRRSTWVKRSPYECGIVPSRDVAQRFPVHFYLVAMIFIVFDIEIIFLYPWAVIYRDIGAFGLVAIALFTVPVVVGLLYEISTGTFAWGDSRLRRSLERRTVLADTTGTAEAAAQPRAAVSVERTGMSTVRRVGLDGRPPPSEPDVEEVVG